jgi:hypothetical protein
MKKETAKNILIFIALSLISTFFWVEILITYLKANIW